MKSISLLRTGVAVFAFAFAGCVQAQAWPSRAIHFIVPFPASGATDILARALGAKLSEALGQPVVIDNRPGAGGSIGSDIAAKAAPDGYTILMATTSTHSVGPALQKLPYDPVKDFAPVSLVATSPVVLIVSPLLGVSNATELIALAKSKPGQLNYSSSGNGTVSHLSGELFKSMAGVDIQHVPYKGTALAIPDLINGRIALQFDIVVSAMPYVKSGKVKALAVTSLTRSALVPDLPTLSESGVPGYESVTYFGVFAPAGTPRNIVARLNREIARIVHTPEMKEQLGNLGADPVGSTPGRFAAVIKAETDKWSKVIKAARVKAD